MLTQEDVLRIYKEHNAYLQGHFKLSSGLHSEYYLQSALVLQYPHDASLLCLSVAEHFKNGDINVVIAPAMGGILVSYEIARILGKNVKSVFLERINGVLVLRRGFNISEHDNILIVEDVITTGKSVLETINVVKEYTRNIVGVGCLVDRSGNFDTQYHYFPLLKLNIRNYTEQECPLCKKNVPLTKPGSRFRA